MTESARGYWRGRRLPNVLFQAMRGHARGPGPVFVVGTGRSGTHWLGHILASHEDVRALIEARPMFRWVTDMAVYPERRPMLLPQLIRRYRLEMLSVAPRLLADKSHPALWLMDELSRAFPAARFLGIERGPLATVSSMLRHRHVRAWTEEWSSYPQPSPFFGTTSENLEDYAHASLASRCAYRWVSHTAELRRRQREMPKRVLVLDYADLQRRPREELWKLRAFLDLHTTFPSTETRTASLDRWRSEMTDDAVRDVLAVVAESGLTDRTATTGQ